MTTIYATRDTQERYDTVRPEMVGKQIKLLKRQGWGNVRVVQSNNVR
jgi:ribosomal protein S19